MIVIGVMVGALIGWLIDDRSDSIVSGGVLGLIVAVAIRAWKARSAPAPAAMAPVLPAGIVTRLEMMETRLASLELALERAGIAVRRLDVPEASLAGSAPAVANPMPADAATPSAASITSPTVMPPPMPAYSVRTPARTNPVWAWIAGGNTLARVGIIVVFFGVGFLLKYASEHYVFAPGLRIAVVGLAGLVLLALGLRLRNARKAYAMILQGGGVGVLYLAVFAALKLYALVPPLTAFALLFVIAVASVFLAVRQDSVALAAIGAIGGFFAPILTSSESGSHVLLFAYYALLNAGIFGVAWFKAWRPLNLLGFACTFVIGTVWGVLRYRAADFATTEPFLTLFFLFYVGIAVLYALRRSIEVRRYVDATIVFGTPLVTAGLQQALVRPFEFAMAISAFGASVLYLALGRLLALRKRDDLALLADAFLALGVMFATLAVPLAFGVHWTSATWALEGAALVWVGVHQHRAAPRAFGLALQLAAGVAFALGWTDAAEYIVRGVPIMNGTFIGGALIAGAGLGSACLLALHREVLRPWEPGLAAATLAWGTAWWLIAGGVEIDRWMPAPSALAAATAFLAGTALGFAYSSRRLAWHQARVPALLLLPVLLVISVCGIARGSHDGWHVLGHGGAFAWTFAFVAWALILRDIDRSALAVSQRTQRLAHGGFFWLLLLVAVEELAWLVTDWLAARGAWGVAVWGFVPAIGVLAVSALASRSAWPVGAHRRAYLLIGCGPALAWVLAFALVANLTSDGAATPLPYLPLFNPLDLTLALCALAIVQWSRTLLRAGVDLRDVVPRYALYGVPAALAFIWANAILLRTLHHGFGLAWTFEALWQSTLVQAALSLLWAVIALATMVMANRRGLRTGWITGASLLAAVIVKLFVVDLSRAGGIERIVSFLGVGVLLLLIGYLAPVPTARAAQEPPS